MNSTLLKSLNEKFANQFEIKFDEIGSFVRFPAKSSDFGDVVIYAESERREEYQGGYLIELGKVTHCHIYSETLNESVAEIIEFLENLFADRIICYERGCCLKEELDGDEGTLLVWSGIYKEQ